MQWNEHSQNSASVHQSVPYYHPLTYNEVIDQIHFIGTIHKQSYNLKNTNNEAKANDQHQKH
jgi:hypothetical protein